MPDLPILAESRPITLYLDECLPRNTFEVLVLPMLRVSGVVPVMIHATDDGYNDVSDDVIADRVAAEGWWMVSKDNGMSNRGPKLPLVFAERKITHARFSRKLNNADSITLARAFAATWDGIRDAFTDSTPKRITICTGNRYGFRLQLKTLD